ncbi:MAG: cyclic nucleotide-binding domain-containing protein [Anaerolineae bacterium]
MTGRKRNKSTFSSGLYPAKLLQLPNVQRHIINQLTRRKYATAQALQQALPDFSGEEIEAALRALKEAAYIKEIFVEGKIQYRPSFSRLVSQTRRSLTGRLWDRLKLDTLPFLRQTPLFKGLPDAALKNIARALTAHRYERNEVIVWQGEPSDSLYVIKSGIVGITHISPGSANPQLLAYLKEGETLGAEGILQAQSRSATATALSSVETLALSRNDFLTLLNREQTVSIELAHILSRRLLATNLRLGASQTEPRLVLLFRLTRSAGRTVIACALAGALARQSTRPTVYTEYPTAHNLPARFGFAGNAALHRHPGGFDILVPQTGLDLPRGVRATLMLDELMGRYTNILIGLPGEIEAGVDYMLERADQVLVVAPPGAEAQRTLAHLTAQLKRRLHPEKTALFTVVSRARPEDQPCPCPEEADFDFPYMPDLPPLPEMFQTGVPLPQPLTDITQTLVGRLGRTHQIGIYIPTTIEVDREFDTTPYLEKTLAFLGQRFGGATSRQAQGVWDSDDAGLVSETVHIVRSFVTQADMNAHLNSVLAFVEDLKGELEQEAMAVEVDGKLMLV